MQVDGGLFPFKEKRLEESPVRGQRPKNGTKYLMVVKRAGRSSELGQGEKFQKRNREKQNNEGESLEGKETCGTKRGERNLSPEVIRESL